MMNNAQSFGHGEEFIPDVVAIPELPDPLRTMIELDAFTGLRRGELIGFRWEDVDFEELVLHVRRSVVAMVEGAPKTEASQKDVPLDAQTAESLFTWRQTCPYPAPEHWVFASPAMKGKQPYWPGSSGDIMGGAISNRQSGDLEGLSRTEQADSQSVDELIEEGNIVEAGSASQKHDTRTSSSSIGGEPTDEPQAVFHQLEVNRLRSANFRYNSVQLRREEEWPSGS